MNNPKNASVPIIILSGFLGSGKTTLLLRLLQEAKIRSLQTGILMNELGVKDVDGEIATNGNNEHNLEKLLDGCICCTKKSEISSSILKLLIKQPDWIVIELTGVANPEEVVDAFTEPDMMNRVHLHATITIVDAEHVLDYNSIFTADREMVHTLRRQIETADWLIVNKTDLITPHKLIKVETALRKQNNKSPIIQSHKCDFPLAPMMSALQPINYENQNSKLEQRKPHFGNHRMIHNHSHTHSPSFSRIQTCTLQLENSTDFKRVERFLKKLGDRLLRAKGYLRRNNPSNELLQFAGKRIYWEPTSYQGPPYIVLIGIALDLAYCEQEWLAMK